MLAPVHPVSSTSTCCAAFAQGVISQNGHPAPLARRYPYRSCVRCGWTKALNLHNALYKFSQKGLIDIITSRDRRPYVAPSTLVQGEADRIVQPVPSSRHGEAERNVGQRHEAVLTASRRHLDEPHRHAVERTASGARAQHDTQGVAPLVREARHVARDHAVRKGFDLLPVDVDRDVTRGVDVEQCLVRARKVASAAPRDLGAVRGFSLSGCAGRERVYRERRGVVVALRAPGSRHRRGCWRGSCAAQRQF